MGAERAQEAGFPRMSSDYNVDDYWNELFFLKVMGTDIECRGLILRQTDLLGTYTG